MNRLLSLSEVAQSLSLNADTGHWSHGSDWQVDSSTVGDARTPHTVVAPMHYEKGYAYPLVIWLHSAASDETELREVMPAISRRNYVGIAPRGVSTPATVEGQQERQVQAADWHQTIDDVAAAEERVLDSIEVARGQFNIATNRVFLAGFGSGGTMALRIAFCNPTRFAGVISVSGHLPDGGRPLRQLDRIRDLPVLLVATHPSREYDQSRLCRDLRLLHAVGGNVDLRQYLGEDDLTTDMLADLNHWMMQRVCAE